jgi:hypothetical protein
VIVDRVFAAERALPRLEALAVCGGFGDTKPKDLA